MDNISLDLSKTTGLVCEKCNGNLFTDAFLLRKASRLITGTAKDALIPINVFVCIECKHVNENFIPVELKEEFKN